MRVWAERARLEFCPFHAAPTRTHRQSNTLYHYRPEESRPSSDERQEQRLLYHKTSNSFRQFGLLFVLRPRRSNHSFISNSPTRKARGIMARRKQVGLLLKAGLDWQFDRKSTFSSPSLVQAASRKPRSLTSPYPTVPEQFNPSILIRYINHHLPKYPASSSNLPRIEIAKHHIPRSSTTTTFYPRHLPYLTHTPLPTPTIQDPTETTHPAPTIPPATPNPLVRVL